MGQSGIHNPHRVRGLPLRRVDGVIHFESGILKEKLNREQGILADALDESPYMTLDKLVEEMNLFPVSEEIMDRIELFEREDLLPLASYSQGTHKLLVGVKCEYEDASKRASQIGIGFQEMTCAETLLLNKDDVNYLLLSPIEFQKIIPLVSDEQARRDFLDTIDGDAAAEEIYFALIKNAIKKGATDIHIEPLTKGNRVRYRIDGVLQVHDHSIPDDKFLNVINIFKERSGVEKLEEKLVAQDGSIMFDEIILEKFPELSGYSLRVATMPTNHGEKVAVRVLDSEPGSFSLESLGYSAPKRKKITELSKQPQGLILVTGPTGSGKTTTLYSILESRNNDEVNIVTIEDPIEKDLEGINQSGINNRRGWGFEKSIKAYLRQDPDIIFVGEIRDPEPAKVAMDASSTGHLVFSTMHTNDSVSSLVRLIELGVDFSIIQANLSAALAQRLSRKLCTECREHYDAKDELNELLQEEFIKRGLNLYRPPENPKEKCLNCEGYGYKGRTSVSELWVLGNKERQMMLEGVKSHKAYYDVAIDNGMVPLVCSGLDLVFQKVTSIDEILRTASPRAEFLEKKEHIKRFIRDYQKK
ncbi:type II/IV secretion system protein [Candidatus Pacearchaeota archaeon]|nr:type II/IV secretion system protein [Candidatus Pacearchaeota archaeon]